ncbi:aspartate--ammonia ligase [Adhaeribacter rhizoryzae]|uniref:Aspartate--ammonia ligase n=1 Tax=Adhaeribacter rhizoryzae TaxID=2607907 RepID=A0A5M6D7M0_9BACT|nr:aspartate--ammonia ligase [Adhaeribacter rhizoryzae]KAA5543521.1 aspartate--ammonia ligase [Adhaeribacter rhizoryzae]
MSQNLYIPKQYQPLLNLARTEKAIKLTKDFFERQLSAELRLRRVTAPLFVLKGTGINDDLNGIERPVSFPIKYMQETHAEIVHSLAKWKRLMLAKLQIKPGFGLYTDMNAIRPDEDLDNIHSLYVDQWDWERVMQPEERNLDFLKKIVERLYGVMKRTEYLLSEEYPELEPQLPENITFIHTEDLLRQYPDLTSKEREDRAAKEFGAIFIIGIGGKLSNGQKHDGRAPDYDDWTTESEPGYHGLNGDIVVWNSLLDRSFELSSMGIRVNQEALLRQLALAGCEERANLQWHQMLLNGQLPQTIGGGIGQSRLCMYFLRKAHIGEVQSSLWPDDLVEKCQEHNIILL